MAAARTVLHGLAAAVVAVLGIAATAAESARAQEPPQSFPGVVQGPRIPPAYQPRVIRAPLPVATPSDWQPVQPPPAPQPVPGAPPAAAGRNGDPAPVQGAFQPADGDLREPPRQPPVDGDLNRIATARPIDPERDAAFADGGGFDIFSRRPEIDPLTDRRPRRFFRFEPYEALGIPLGSFVLFPELELAAGATSNALGTATQTISDMYLRVRPTIDLLSNWRTHALEFRATGLASFYDRVSSEDEREALVEARGRIDISKRTQVAAQVSYQVQQESSRSIDARGGGTDNGDIVTQRAAARFQHRFNRLTVQLRGSVSTFDYGSVAAAGGVLTQSDRDYVARDAAVRASYEFKPNLIVFSEVQGDWRRYDVPAASDGILRTSSGWRTRFGVSAGQVGGIVRGALSLGYAVQSPDDDRLQDVSGLIIDANLAWRLSGLTTFLFNASSEIGETTLAGSAGALVRSVGVEARHALKRHIIASAGLSLTASDYQGLPVEERDWLMRAGLDYYVNRSLKLWARIEHTIFRSTQAGRDYDETEGLIGLTMRR